MKTTIAFALVLASVISYLVLATQFGVFQRVPWPHYLGALVGVAWLVSLVREKFGWGRLLALVVASLLTLLYGYWTLLGSNYVDRQHRAAAGETLVELTSLELANAAGQPTRLLGEGLTLVVFYRGYWCPYCRQELIQLQQQLPAFQQRGVRVVAVAVDPPDKLEVMRQASQATFEFLSDPHGQLLDLLDIRHAKAGDQGQDIAQSAAFLLQPQGKIVWRHLARNYRERVAPSTLLAAVDQAVVASR